jgi:ABC-type transport system involved in multi-copper enzyme maturation permease subunit
MSVPRTRSRIPVLGSIGRTLRLAWVELTKLFAHKFFPFTLVVTVVVAAGLGLAGKHFARTATSSDGSSFSNYSLWVVTSSFGLQLGTVLLMVVGAMSVSSEATARTLNTMLTRPVRRFEFLLGKALSLVFATVLVVAAAGVSGYVMGGTVPRRTARQRVVVTPEGTTKFEPEAPRFPSYGDVVDPVYPEYVIATKREVMGDILYGFVLLAVPILAAASIGFLFGVLLDSTALAVGLTVALFVFLEAVKFRMILGEAFSSVVEYAGRYGYGEPINKITGLMISAGKGSPPSWEEAVAGVQVSALYVLGCMVVSFIVFCRRDVSL